MKKYIDGRGGYGRTIPELVVHHTDSLDGGALERTEQQAESLVELVELVGELMDKGHLTLSEVGEMLAMDGIREAQSEEQ